MKTDLINFIMDRLEIIAGFSITFDQNAGF